MKWNASVPVLLLLCFLTSCVSNKELTYFNDKEKSEELIDKHIKLNEKPYKLQIGDLLSINIKASDEKLVAMFQPKTNTNINNPNTQQSSQGLYFNGFTVDVHGNINIPLLGELNVLGYTTEEVSKLVHDKLLEEYFTEEANIFVIIKLAGLRFTVTGEVEVTGIYTLYQDRVNIIEALASAGDIGNLGNRKDVLIIRQYPDGQKIHHIDLTKADAFDSPYYHIKPNDMIYVKPLKQKSLGTGATLVQSITTVVTVLSLVTSVLLLSRNL